MKCKNYIALATLLVLAGNMFGQSSTPALTLNPASISPSSVNLVTSIAGATFANPFVNYSTQKVKYSWPNEGGHIYVYSSTIPNGFTYTVEADDAISGWIWWNGAQGHPTGQVTVDSNQRVMIDGIGRCAEIVCPLTQNLTITDFSQLHSGSYLMSINFIIRNY